MGPSKASSTFRGCLCRGVRVCVCVCLLLGVGGGEVRSVARMGVPQVCFACNALALSAKAPVLG